MVHIYFFILMMLSGALLFHAGYDIGEWRCRTHLCHPGPRCPCRECKGEFG